MITKVETLLCIALLFCVSSLHVGARAETAGPGNVAQARVDQRAFSGVEFITAEELKAKIAKSEPLTIIDVRATSGLSNNDNKIKGAIYVKLRRLKSRLALPPLKNVPRNQAVVTYCACPNDEASVRAAQLLKESGFTHVRVLKGGWVVWKKANGQVEPLASGI